MGILWMRLLTVACMLMLAAADNTPTKILLNNTYEILVHQQSAAVINAFGSLEPVGILSVWKDGKPSS